MKKYLLGFLIALSISIPAYRLLKAANSDASAIGGQGIYWSKDMYRIDSNYNLRLYNGSLVFGDNGLTPSSANPQTSPTITTGGFYGIKLPITNGSSSTSSIGQVVCSSTLASGIQGTFVSATATTSILGVVDGSYVSGATMYMTTHGYALVLTTGAVLPGQLLVSSATASGRAGAANGTVVVGTVIGKALTVGAAAGDSVLALINIQ